MPPLAADYTYHAIYDDEMMLFYRLAAQAARLITMLRACDGFKAHRRLEN